MILTIIDDVEYMPIQRNASRAKQCRKMRRKNFGWLKWIKDSDFDWQTLFIGSWLYIFAIIMAFVISN